MFYYTLLEQEFYECLSNSRMSCAPEAGKMLFIMVLFAKNESNINIWLPATD